MDVHIAYQHGNKPSYQNRNASKEKMFLGGIHTLQLNRAHVVQKVQAQTKDTIKYLCPNSITSIYCGFVVDLLFKKSTAQVTFIVI